MSSRGLRKNRINLNHLTVQRDVGNRILWHIVFIEDGINRALDDARVAVNATIWVDVQHFGPNMKAVYGANRRASCVFASNTLLGNHVSHLFPLLFRISVCQIVVPDSGTKAAILSKKIFFVP